MEKIMKITINRKRYDTEKCKIIAHKNHYNYSNNYSGTSYVGVASDGQWLIWCDSNGQDCYISDYVDNGNNVDLDDYEMDTDEEANGLKLGIITNVL